MAPGQPDRRDHGQYAGRVTNVRKRVSLALLFVTAASAHINITTVAAATTIAVNALEIKTTIAKARAAAKVAKKTVKKVVKKVSG